MNYSILPMCGEHVDGMAEVEQRCFSMPWSYNMIKDELTNEFAVYYVAECGGRVVGYAGIHMIFDSGHITNVAVSPESRRNGIASALVDKLLRIADNSGVKSVTLEVRESNEGAKKLYESKGFVTIAVRRNYYSLPSEDALLMRRCIE